MVLKYVDDDDERRVASSNYFADSCFSPKSLDFMIYINRFFGLVAYTVDGLRQTFSTSQNAFVFVDIFVLVGFFMLFILPAIKLLYRRFV